MARIAYFDGYGRAEMIRMMFRHKGVDFTDERIDLANEWPAMKESGRFPLKSLPEVTLDGVVMVQSRAAARAVAIKFGFYSSEAPIVHQIDAILDFNQETNEPIWAYVFDPEKTDEKNKKWEEDWAKKHKILEARLAGHGKKFIAGTDKPTLADFSVAGIYLMTVYNQGWMAQGPLCDVVKAQLEKCPHLKRYCEQTLTTEFAKYLSERPVCPF